MDSIVSVLIISVKVDGAIPHGVSDRTTAPDPETQRALHWTGKNELPQCGAFSYSLIGEMSESMCYITNMIINYS